jgi:hypothetical protein
LGNPEEDNKYVFPSLFLLKKSTGRGKYVASAYSTSITTFGFSILEGAPLAPLLMVLDLKG